MSDGGLRSYSVAGPAHGPTYVLLHGIGLSHREFGGLARELSATGRVISFDLPGFGPTPRPRERISVEEYAAMIDRHLRTVALDRVVVVGHSMGAQFAIEVARQNPLLVTELVLIGPVVDTKKPTLRAQAMSLMRDSPLEPPATQAMVLFDYARCGIPWFATEVVVMRDYPTAKAITDVKHPILIIRGEKDPVADAPWCESLAADAPDGRTVSIAGHRHNVLHSAPAETAAAIVDFLAECDAREGVRTV